MRFRTIGDTDVQVSEIGFGVWTVATSWWGVTDEAFGIRLLQHAFDQGVTFFDTADAYGNARSLRAHDDRHEVRIRFLHRLIAPRS
jgi:aryl-alcohol dehydrogenase-like predicted oxidoreductase